MLGSAWFSDGANVLQYVGSIGLLSWVWHTWHSQCRAEWWCMRPGQILVAGTTWKACPKHSTLTHYAKMQTSHSEKHPEREGS